ncbi:hypothetical protein J2S22_003764 [Rhodoplanes tepidamans]|nr:hypothetical protein [Rhodoplanes tepidamans]
MTPRRRAAPGTRDLLCGSVQFYYPGTKSIIVTEVRPRR